MVIPDFRGIVIENNNWIITRANSVGAISVSVDNLTSQVEAGGAGGKGGWVISSQSRRNSHMVQAYS